MSREAQIKKVQKMDVMDAYRQEEQNRLYFGSLVLGNRQLDAHYEEKEFGLEKLSFNDQLLAGLEIEDESIDVSAYGVEIDRTEIDAELNSRIEKQKKLIKNNESDNVDLMELTNQNPYLIAEWLRASSVAHSSSQGFTDVVAAMDNLLTSNAEETQNAARILKKNVQAYLASHKARPLTISGRQRVRMCRGILERVDLFPALVNWQNKFREQKKAGNGARILSEKLDERKSTYEKAKDAAIKRQKLDNIEFKDTKQTGLFTDVLKGENETEKESAAWNDSFVQTAIDLQKVAKEGAEDEKLENVKAARAKVLDSMVDELNSLKMSEIDRFIAEPDYFADNYARLERLLRIADYFKSLGNDEESFDAFYIEDKQYFVEKATDKSNLIGGLLYFNDSMMNFTKHYYVQRDRLDLSGNVDMLHRLSEFKKNAFKKDFQRNIEKEGMPSGLTQEFYDHFSYLNEPEINCEKLVSDVTAISKNIDKIIRGFNGGGHATTQLPTLKEAERIEKSGTVEEKYAFIVVYSVLEPIAAANGCKMNKKYEKINDSIRDYFGPVKYDNQGKKLSKKLASDQEKLRMSYISWSHAFGCNQRIASQYKMMLEKHGANPTEEQRYEAQKATLLNATDDHLAYMWQGPYRYLTVGFVDGISEGITEIDYMIREIDGMNKYINPLDISLGELNDVQHILKNDKKYNEENDFADAGIVSFHVSSGAMERIEKKNNPKDIGSSGSTESEELADESYF